MVYPSSTHLWMLFGPKSEFLTPPLYTFGPSLSFSGISMFPEGRSSHSLRRVALLSGSRSSLCFLVRTPWSPVPFALTVCTCLLISLKDRIALWVMINSTRRSLAMVSTGLFHALLVSSATLQCSWEHRLSCLLQGGQGWDGFGVGMAWEDQGQLRGVGQGKSHFLPWEDGGKMLLVGKIKACLKSSVWEDFTTMK